VTPYSASEDFESMTVGDRPTPSSAVSGADQLGWNPFQSPRVSNTRAFSGTNSLEFVYPAQPTPDEVVVEQRFVLGRSLGEFWMRFMWFVPSNYTHRNVGGAGPTAKLFQMWKGSYSSQSIRWGVSLNRTGSNGSIIYPTATRGNEPDVTQAPVQNYVSGFGANFISSTGIIVPGGWYELKFHFKPASSRTDTDGIWKLWVGNTLFMDGGGRLWPPLHGSEQSEDPTVDQGYLMGSHNSGFLDETRFYIDGLSFTTVNPGW
jgi:hypothetical protein